MRAKIQHHYPLCWKVLYLTHLGLGGEQSGPSGQHLPPQSSIHDEKGLDSTRLKEFVNL